MVSTQKDPVLAVLSLSGGNDGLNTVIPYSNPLYRDYRPTLGIPEGQIIPINDDLGFHPTMGPLKKFWDEGKLAIFLGVGYDNPSYSHFRSMDIWHTCEPDKIGTEGWLGRVLKEIDPSAENVLCGVNFGRGLPRALVMEGVPVASVGNLETYGLLTGIDGESQRDQALDVFGRMYSPAMGSGAVMDYIHSTGTNALKGADILATAPDKYTSEVEYSNTVVGQYMKNIAQTHLAEFGSRVLYTTSPYNSFDTHANQAPALRPVERRVQQRGYLLPGPAEPQRQRQRDAAHVHRVWPPHLRQRFRHRPRRRRHRLGCGRARQGRHLRRVPVPGTRPAGRGGQPPLRHGLPLHLHHHRGRLVQDGLPAQRRRFLREGQLPVGPQEQSLFDSGKSVVPAKPGTSNPAMTVGAGLKSAPTWAIQAVRLFNRNDTKQKDEVRA